MTRTNRMRFRIFFTDRLGENQGGYRISSASRFKPRGVLASARRPPDAVEQVPEDLGLAHERGHAAIACLFRACLFDDEGERVVGVASSAGDALLEISERGIA